MAKKNYPLIFIVEDNKAYSKILEYHLEINNYKNIVCILSGEECLKKLYLKPNIIIQDYKLQGISGLNVLQRTKKILPKAEFIFLSGINDLNVAIDSVKSGAYYYIVKDDVALKLLLLKLDEIKVLQIKATQDKRNRVLWIALFVIILITVTALLIH